MELEEKDLTQSKDTKSAETHHMYEAILDDVFFDWLSSSDIGEAEKECRQYLSEFTNAYTIKKFYLKNKDGWA